LIRKLKKIKDFQKLPWFIVPKPADPRFVTAFYPAIAESGGGSSKSEAG
jgi:hypothetical protein